MEKVIIKARRDENRLQPEIKLENYVAGVYLFTSEHLNGKDIIAFCTEDIPAIIAALEEVK